MKSPVKMAECLLYYYSAQMKVLPFQHSIVSESLWLHIEWVRPCFSAETCFTSIFMGRITWLLIVLVHGVTEHKLRFVNGFNCECGYTRPDVCWQETSKRDRFTRSNNGVPAETGGSCLNTHQCHDTINKWQLPWKTVWQGHEYFIGCKLICIICTFNPCWPVNPPLLLPLPIDINSSVGECTRRYFHVKILRGGGISRLRWNGLVAWLTQNIEDELCLNKNDTITIPATDFNSSLLTPALPAIPLK